MWRSRPVDPWEPAGPLLAPLSDALVLVGIAVAVWLAFDGGLERFYHRTPDRGSLDGDTPGS